MPNLYEMIKSGNSLRKYTIELFCFKIIASAALYLFIAYSSASAQIIWAGVKVGGQLNWAKLDDAHFRDTVRSTPTGGFNAGAAILFKVKDRYFLHTEYIYSTKNKVLKGRLDPMLSDQVKYHYIEIPVLFTIQFKGHVGKGKSFKWYLGAGPNLGYLLNARGKVKSFELSENNIADISYHVEFGQRPDTRFYPVERDKIYYPKVNRIQFGINVGTGLLIEPTPKHKMILDLRYTFDQTMFGKRSADYVLPDDYSDNLKFRNRGVKVSLIYLLQYNLSKKERNKGKSSVKF